MARPTFGSVPSHPREPTRLPVPSPVSGSTPRMASTAAPAATRCSCPSSPACWPRRARDAGIPPGVREVIARRLDRLPEDAISLLVLVAIAGDDTDLELLSRAAGIDLDRVAEVLDAAVAIGVLRISPATGRVSFGHALVRDTVLDPVTDLQRRRLHARLAHDLGRNPRRRMRRVRAGPPRRAGRPARATDRGPAGRDGRGGRRRGFVRPCDRRALVGTGARDHRLVGRARRRPRRPAAPCCCPSPPRTTARERTTRRTRSSSRRSTTPLPAVTQPRPRPPPRPSATPVASGCGSAPGRTRFR